MLLEILLPTYNQAKNLRKNLELLSEIYRNNPLAQECSILISDNGSPDDTTDVVKAFSDRLPIEYFRFEQNMGLVKNVYKCLELATADYVMFLSDDDYISAEYLNGVIGKLKIDPTISAIYPNNVSIMPDGSPCDFLRDPVSAGRILEPGWESCLDATWRAHQLSGLVFRRAGLMEACNQYKITNLHPFTFMAIWSSFQGRSWLFFDYPVMITVVPQCQKEWNFGAARLTGELFDNFVKFFGDDTARRFAMERQAFRHTGRFRLFHAGVSSSFGVLWKLMKHPNCSWRFKCYLPFYYVRHFCSIVFAPYEYKIRQFRKKLFSKKGSSK